MIWGYLVLAALATYRLTRLAVTDDLTLPLRQRLADRYPRPGAHAQPHPLLVLANCHWCLSVWVALGLTLALHFAGLDPLWQLLGFHWMAIAAGSGLISKLGG